MKPEFPEPKLLAAVYLFERANGRALEPHEDSELSMADMHHTSAEEIAGQIRQTIESSPSLGSHYRQTAFWALGKRMDPELLGFLRHHLALEVDRDMEAAYQIMIALDNLDEPVWTAAQHGVSSQDHADNRAAALRYLALVDAQR